MGARDERHPVNGANVEPSEQIKCRHNFPLAIDGEGERHEVTRGEVARNEAHLILRTEERAPAELLLFLLSVSITYPKL